MSKPHLLFNHARPGSLVAGQQAQPVLDIVPWSCGLGFQGSGAWWAYVHRQTELGKLELLLIAALLSDDVGALLLTHDRTLLEAFQFSDETIAVLAAITAATISDFAAAFFRHSHLENGNEYHDSE